MTTTTTTSDTRFDGHVVAITGGAGDIGFATAIDVAPLVSHVLGTERFEEGTEVTMHDPERMKVQCSFDHEGEAAA